MPLQAPARSRLQSFTASPLQARALQWIPSISIPGQTDVRCFEEFDSYLYFGTSAGGIVYRTADGHTIDSFAVLTEYIYALYGYSIYLLAGRGEGENQILRTTDGASWGVSHNDAGLERVEGFAAFGSNCYAAATGRGGDEFVILRSADGVTWAEVFSQNGHFGAHCLAVFDGKLYSGSGDGVIMYTVDGTTWLTAVTLLGVTHIHALYVFDSYLYAGCSSPGEVWRSSDGTSWAQVASPAALSSIRDLYAFRGSIFCVGVGDFSVYRSMDGESWERDFDGADTYGLALHDFNGALYAGVGIPAKVYRRY